MSEIDDFCNSKDKTTTEKKICSNFALNLYDILDDMKTKDYLRPKLKVLKGEEERKKYIKVIKNVRKVSETFNQFFDIYVDKSLPETNNRLKKFLEDNKPYGLTEENLVYLLVSEMIFTFLVNIEEFRSAFLFLMKLPIEYKQDNKKRTIDKKTTLGTLLRSLTDLKVQKATELSVIDFDLRNGFSHGLWWVEGDISKHNAYIHYSKDLSFKKVKTISLPDLFNKTRMQSIYTNCLLAVIPAYFL